MFNCVTVDLSLWSFVFVSSGAYFNAPDMPPTIAQIDQSFGATHPASKLVLLVLCFKYAILTVNFSLFCLMPNSLVAYLFILVKRQQLENK